jgi:hypothetical protein
MTWTSFSIRAHAFAIDASVVEVSQAVLSHHLDLAHPEAGGS